MSDQSYFESRSGKLSCNSKDVFVFVTDIRNFERFIPQGTISNWNSEKESCSFSVSMLGTISVRLTEKMEYSKVVFEGDALKKNDFILTLTLLNNADNHTDVRILLSADLNPMMKMIASKPIGQFLEMLINEMESFRDWKNIKK